MMMLALCVVVVSVLLLHVELLELVPGNPLISLVLDVLEGGGGVVSSVLLLHGDFLSPVPCYDTLVN
jgi:hypothetical protein